LYISNTTESVYTNKTYEKTIEPNRNRIGLLAENKTLVDSLNIIKPYFYKDAAEYYTTSFDPLMDSNRQGIQTYQNPEIGIQKTFASTDGVSQGGSGTSASNPHKSCTPFIIVMFTVFLSVIAFIILRRIKTDTLKLF
jgi:hypothetical protein